MAVDAIPSAPPDRRRTRRFRATVVMVPATALLLTMTLISNLARAAEAPVGIRDRHELRGPGRYKHRRWSSRSPPRSSTATWE